MWKKWSVQGEVGIASKVEQKRINQFANLLKLAIEGCKHLVLAKDTKREMRWSERVGVDGGEAVKGC